MKTFKLFTVIEGQRYYLPSSGTYSPEAKFDVDLRDWCVLQGWVILYGYTIYEGQTMVYDGLFQKKMTVMSGDSLVITLPETVFEAVPCLETYLHQIETMLSN